MSRYLVTCRYVFRLVSRVSCWFNNVTWEYLKFTIFVASKDINGFSIVEDMRHHSWAILQIITNISFYTILLCCVFIHYNFFAQLPFPIPAEGIAQLHCLKRMPVCGLLAATLVKMHCQTLIVTQHGKSSFMSIVWPPSFFLLFKEEEDQV